MLCIYCLPGGTSSGVTNKARTRSLRNQYPLRLSSPRTSQSRKNDSTLAVTAPTVLCWLFHVQTSA